MYLTTLWKMSNISQLFSVGERRVKVKRPYLFFKYKYKYKYKYKHHPINVDVIYLLRYYRPKVPRSYVNVAASIKKEKKGYGNVGGVSENMDK